MERQQSRFLRTTPFHRRNQVVEEYVQCDVPRLLATSVLPVNSQSTPVSGASSSQSLTQVGGASGSETTNMTSVNLESPSSNAPSPLEDSHNSSQLENGTAMDPTMPTLSPHPPIVKHVEKEAIAPKPTQIIDPNATQTLNNNNTASVLVNGVSTDTNAFHKPQSSVLKLENANACVTSSNNSNSNNNNNNIQWNQQSLDSTKANINSWLRSQQKQSEHKTFKRPALPTLDSGHEDLVTDSLYNFDSVSNW